MEEILGKHVFWVYQCKTMLVSPHQYTVEQCNSYCTHFFLYKKYVVFFQFTFLHATQSDPLCTFLMLHL